MCFEFVRKLPSPEEISSKYPLSDELKIIKKNRDLEIAKVISGRSEKFLVIVGPCSADNEDAVCEYVRRLKKIYNKVRDKIILIPRIYTNKPRTNGLGYKGMAHQPDLNRAPDLIAGLEAIRKLHIRVVEETGLTAADEMLYSENWPYLSDVLSYVAIGARSVEDQQHRLAVSGLDIPAGFKNPTSGDLSVVLNSVIAAQSDHSFAYRGWEVKTTGNKLSHAILRGAVDKSGMGCSNYHYEDLVRMFNLFENYNISYKAAIIDSNHGNSNKNGKQQIRIVKDVLNSRKLSINIKDMVKGVMIESYLIEGNQNIHNKPLVFGKSVTDECLGWEETEQLIYEISELC